MEAHPPVLIEAIVGRLVPPVCREEVLGDLHERYTTLPRYVLTAAAVIPYVVFSRMRRTADGLLLAMQAFVLFLVVRPVHPNGPSDWIRPAIAIGCALIALALCDAFERSRQGASQEEPAIEFDASVGRAASTSVVAMAMVWLVQEAMTLLDVDAAFCLSAPARFAVGGALMLLPVRVAWTLVFRGSGHRRVTLGSLKREDFSAESWRLALERRRDVLRRSWLWYLTLPVVGSFARVASADRLYPEVVDVALSMVIAVALLRALGRRLAAFVQREIDRAL